MNIDKVQLDFVQFLLIQGFTLNSFDFIKKNWLSQKQIFLLLFAKNLSRFNPCKYSCSWDDNRFYE